MLEYLKDSPWKAWHVTKIAQHLENKGNCSKCLLMSKHLLFWSFQPLTGEHQPSLKLLLIYIVNIVSASAFFCFDSRVSSENVIFGKIAVDHPLVYLTPYEYFV